VSLEVRSLADGSIMATEHCEDPDPAIAYGEIRDAIHDEDRFLFGDCRVPPGADPTCDPTRDACSVPSRELLDAWCDAWQPRCVTMGAHPGVADVCTVVSGYCETTQHHDAGAARPDAGDNATDDASAGHADDASAGRADAGSTRDDAEAQAASASGCSAAGGGNAAPNAPWMLASILLVAGGRYRSRKSPRMHDRSQKQPTVLLLQSEVVPSQQSVEQRMPLTSSR